MLDAFQTDLDRFRAAFLAVCRTPEGHFQPVHWTRIAALARRVGLEGPFSPFRDQLNTLAEAQKLPHGYWLPTPPRRVSIPGFDLLVTPQATPELARLVAGEVAWAGLARVTPEGQGHPLPLQPMASWLGTPPDLASWTRTILLRAEQKMQDSLFPERGIFFFLPQVNPSKPWLEPARVDRQMTDLVLARIEGTPRRYFLCRWKGNDRFQESPLKLDWPLLCLGIRHLNDLKGIIYLKKDESQWRLSPGFWLPLFLTRLLNALGTPQRMGNDRYSYHFHTTWMESLRTLLTPFAVELR